MNQLLMLGDAPFMLVKLAIGGFAAYMLFRASHLALARHGMRLVLTIYGLLMMAHFATGMFALGWPAPMSALNYISNVPGALLTLFG